MNCPVCGGQAGVLGSLGNRVHYVCRDCGMQFSKIRKPRKKKMVINASNKS